MSALMSNNMLRPARDTRTLLIKWIVALFAPVAVFTFVWSGEAIINNVLLGFITPGSTPYDTPTLIAAAIFILIFYTAVITLSAYLVAADSGRRGMIDLWIDIAVFALVPLFLVINFGLIIGLALCAIVWPIYFFGRNLVRKAHRYIEDPNITDEAMRATVKSRAKVYGFRFGVVLAVFALIVGLSGFSAFIIGHAFGLTLAPIPFIVVDVLGSLILALILFAAGYLLVRLGGVAVSGLFLYLRPRLPKAASVTASQPLQSLSIIDAERQAVLMGRATAGGFWFATVFAVVWLVVDLIFFFNNGLPQVLLIWVAIRTLILPVAGYFLGQLAGSIALRRTLSAQENGNGGNETNGARRRISRRQQLQALSTTRLREEARDLVPNDLPLRSAGATRFFLILLVAFVLFYPVIDPFLFGAGTDGRLAGYGDAGFYVILALGLNIVVGFAGLLDLGYVAFFAIGAYAWGMIGSTQLTNVLNIPPVNPQILSWLFWPMLLGAALIAAFWGVVLGAPTLRLRGDYLAIVTLGFGEIVPIVFLELDKYTNGTNGIVGVQSPAFFGIQWSIITPGPYYYLILALIALTIFANIRLRDSRLGRAWIAIREDEIAAASSGINLVNTKLFAFGAGAFFSGIAGAYHAAKLGGVSPDNFSFGDSVVYLSMVVIGGIGSIPGVIVGALAVYAIQQFILAQLDTLASDPTNFMFTVKSAIVYVIPGFTFGNVRNLIFGIILVVIMIFRPEGLIPSARRRRELHASTAETPEVGTLDVMPGTPGFEEEVRVE